MRLAAGSARTHIDTFLNKRVVFCLNIAINLRSPPHLHSLRHFMPTKWRSHPDHRYCDVTSPYAYWTRNWRRLKAALLSLQTRKIIVLDLYLWPWFQISGCVRRIFETKISHNLTTVKFTSMFSVVANGPARCAASRPSSCMQRLTAMLRSIIVINIILFAQ